MPISFSTPEASAMAEALSLTRSGRLAEATAVIQRALGGSPSPNVTHTVQQMSDVPVPATRALTDRCADDPRAQATKAPHRPRSAEPTPTPPTCRARPQRSPRHPSSNAARVASPELPSPPNRGSLAGLESLPGLGSLPHLVTLLDRSSFPGVGPLPDLASLPGRPGGAKAATSRPYRLHVPDQLPHGPRPLLVLLHGGTQDAASFADATGFDALADEHGFLVLYPEQLAAANPMRYWNWFNRSDQQRGAGEPAILVGLVDEIAAEHPIDRDRVFVAGFSAGAAMSSVLGATYPDVFAGIGVHSGLAHGAAGDMISAFSAMGRAPSVGAVDPVPAIVIHGDADSTVHVSNADSVLEQFAPAGATRRTVTERVNGRQVERTILVADGRTVAESLVISGAGHAWSGGRAGGSYADPSGPDAAAEMVRFFGIATDDVSGT